MKIAFTTLGCKLNFAESSALGKALIERGHTKAKQGEEADICIINTCTVTDAADHKDRQMIHRIRRQNPKAILIVTGCYAQLKPGEIAQIEGRSSIFPISSRKLRNQNSAISIQIFSSLRFGRWRIFMGRTARMTGRDVSSRCRTDVTISAVIARSPWHAVRVEILRSHRW